MCHAGTVIVNEYVKAGSNCRIHAGVNIGNSSAFGPNWVPAKMIKDKGTEIMRYPHGDARY